MKEIIINLSFEINFLRVWLIAPIVLIVVYDFLCAHHRKKTFSPTPKPQLRSVNLSISIDVGSLITIALFSFFLCAYIFLMFYEEDFAYHDNSVLTSYSLQGKFYGLPIWRDIGRFWPLGLQEYNFLALVGKTQLVYRSFSVFQLLIVLLAINKIQIKFPLWHRLLTMTLVIVTPSFVIPFFGFIYPERNVIFWLAILLVCSKYNQLKAHGSRIYLYGGLIAANVCLYYKEPVFLLIGAFAGARLVLNMVNYGETLKQANDSTFIKANYMDFGLVALSAVFVLLYQIEVASHVESRYLYNAGESAFFTLLSYTRSDFLLSTFLATFALRLTYTIFSKKLLDSFWDPLALGGSLYFLAFVKLNMYTQYYMAPVDFIAALYLGSFSYNALMTKTAKVLRFRKFVWFTVTAILAILIVNQSLQKSSISILFRKNYIAGNVQLANALEQYAESSNKDLTSLFFPSSTEPYSMAEFAAFLDYRGINLYHEGDHLSNQIIESTQPVDVIPKEKTTFILKAPHSFQNNLCMPYTVFQCFYASVPEASSLIVVLPKASTTPVVSNIPANDIRELNKEIVDLKRNSRTIFAYKPNFSTIEEILLVIARRQDIYLEIPWMEVYLMVP